MERKEELVRDYLQKIVECKNADEFVSVFEGVWEKSDEDRELLSDGVVFMSGLDCELYEDISCEEDEERVKKRLEILKRVAEIELEYLEGKLEYEEALREVNTAAEDW